MLKNIIAGKKNSAYEQTLGNMLNQAITPAQEAELRAIFTRAQR